MEEESKAEFGRVAGRGGSHETIADTQPKIFFGTEEDKSPTDLNRDPLPKQSNNSTSCCLDSAMGSRKDCSVFI